VGERAIYVPDCPVLVNVPENPDASCVTAPEGEIELIALPDV
jgi:hypothetical protein